MTQTSPIDRPPVHEAVLDADALSALIRDITALTEILEVRIKTSQHPRAQPADCTIEEATQRLLQHDVTAVQIRYRLGDSEWWDTLLAVPNGVRIVRLSPPKFD